MRSGESGEHIELPESFRPLLDAATHLYEARFDAFVLVGGVAVAIRLAQAHALGLASFTARATVDVDAAVLPTDPPTPRQLVAARVGTAPRDGAHRGAVKVETIEVQRVTAADLAGLGVRDTLFVAGHWFAVESSQQLAVRSGALEAVLPIARSPALVAMKLHAALSRRDERPHKLAGDIIDIHHLLEAFDSEGNVSDELARRPVLGRAVLAGAQELLIDDAARSARAVRAWSDRSVWLPTRDDLRDTGERLTARLSRMLGSEAR